MPVALVLSLLLNASVALDWQTLVSIAPITIIMTGIAILSSHLLGLTRIKLNAYEYQGIVRTSFFLPVFSAFRACV